MRALESQLQQAETDYDRARQLAPVGHDSAGEPGRCPDPGERGDRPAGRRPGPEREATQEMLNQGAILAPVNGRVLEVHTADGSVMMPGEPLATIAEET